MGKKRLKKHQSSNNQFSAGGGEACQFIQSDEFEVLVVMQRQKS